MAAAVKVSKTPVDLSLSGITDRLRTTFEQLTDTQEHIAILTALTIKKPTLNTQLTLL